MRTSTKWMIVASLTAGGFFAYFKGYREWQPLRQTAPKTEQPAIRNIVRKKVFSGHIKPHKEVELKPNIPGIVDKLLVQVGDCVQQGTAVARIKVQPTIQEVEAATSALRTASIVLTKTRAKYLRDKQLFRKKMLAQEAYEMSLEAWSAAKEKFSLTEKALQAVQLGYTQGKGRDAHIVKVTTKGTILALPVKEGSLVQPMGGQSPGSVIAIVGDMSCCVFSAYVHELDAAYLTKGMSFQAELNAFKGEKLSVKLTKVSLAADKSALDYGEVKFAIEGIVTNPKNSKIILRSGYIAHAEVIVEQANHVLTVPEKMICTEETTYYVKCWEGNKIVKKKIILGLSDGWYVEIKQGLTEEDQLIVE